MILQEIDWYICHPVINNITCHEIWLNSLLINRKIFFLVPAAGQRTSFERIAWTQVLYSRSSVWHKKDFQSAKGAEGKIKARGHFFLFCFWNLHTHMPAPVGVRQGGWVQIYLLENIKGADLLIAEATHDTKKSEREHRRAEQNTVYRRAKKCDSANRKCAQVCETLRPGPLFIDSGNSCRPFQSFILYAGKTAELFLRSFFNDASLS